MTTPTEILWNIASAYKSCVSHRAAAILIGKSEKRLQQMIKILDEAKQISIAVGEYLCSRYSIILV